MNNKRFSLEITVFHGIQAPEEGKLVGYGAILEAYSIPVPLPRYLALISKKKRRYEKGKWKVFTPRHEPEDNLYKQLVFALKYEGVNLLLLKKLFERITKGEVEEIVSSEILGQYSRRIWFLYEWLMNEKLGIRDLNRGNPVPLINEKLQYAIKGKSSPRHRIINNLPGTYNFCPLVSRIPKLDYYLSADLAQQKSALLKSIQKDILQRTSAFLLLKDSQASFTIEGESPKSKRMARWGQAIGQAGTKDLTKEELIRLQQVVIENTRFVDMGFRQKGGFVGEHDRTTGEPIPSHISAKWQDVELLIDGLLKTNELLLTNEIDAVLAASLIAFGFVFIHPFQDGNGRIHRYLIHHVLAKKQFAQQGIIFPVSASILDHIDDYRKVLEAYSLELLDFIEWKATSDNNIEVLNETIDYYRYFDASVQAEFLFDCVNDTIRNIIPNEVKYIQGYDEFKRFLDEEFEMPDKMVATLVRFLEQNEGKLSKRAGNKEFQALTEEEIVDIERKFGEVFIDEDN